MLRHGAIAHVLIVCLAASGFVCMHTPAQAQDAGGIDFKLLLLNGEAVNYSLTSPTDGDILDRGFLARDIILTLRADYGEAVVCADRFGVELARARRESCPVDAERDSACFTLSIDTRRLPNGPNRLFFTLYDAYPKPGVDAAVLAELRIVFNVLNPRIEIDARAADGVRLRLDAGVRNPADVKNYRFAIFAGRENAPSLVMNGYVTQGTPKSIPIPVGPDPVKIFPRAENVKDVPWPEASPFLYFNVNRATLVELSGTPVPKPVYLVAAIHDGKAWHWTPVCEVSLPPAGEGKIPALK